jgi:hypothetical protein
MRKTETRNLLLDDNSIEEEMSDLDITAIRLFQKSMKSMIATELETSSSKAESNDDENAKLKDIDEDIESEVSESENESETFHSENEENFFIMNENERVQDRSKSVKRIKKNEDLSDDVSLVKNDSEKKQENIHQTRDDERDQRKKKNSCKCERISLALLERIRRKNAIRARMKSDVECIDILRAMIESKLDETNLRHVCHRYLYAIDDHFDLQIKSLKTTDLRQRLSMI